MSDKEAGKIRLVNLVLTILITLMQFWMQYNNERIKDAVNTIESNTTNTVEVKPK